MLPIGPEDRRHLQRQVAAIDLDLDRRTQTHMNAVGNPFIDCDFTSVRIAPPCTLPDAVSIWSLVRPAERNALQHPPRKMLHLQLLQRYAVQGDKSPADYRQQFQLSVASGSRPGLCS